VKVQLKQDRGVFIFGNRRKLNIKKSLNDGSWQPNLYIFEIILFEMKSLKQIDPKETLKKYLPLKGKKRRYYLVPWPFHHRKRHHTRRYLSRS
jgi:hypothetical protein